MWAVASFDQDAAKGIIDDSGPLKEEHHNTSSYPSPKCPSQTSDVSACQLSAPSKKTALLHFSV